MAKLLEWSADEASGVLVDYSGNGRDLTLSGNTVRTADGAGHTGKAITQTAADVGPGVSLTGLQTASRTWMAWIWVSASFNGWFLEFHNSGSDTGVWGLLYLSGSLNFRAKDSSNNVYQSTGIPPDFGVWHHIAATHDGANLRVYRDGTLLSTTAMAVPVWTANDMRVLDGVGSLGRMDDVRLFDTALTQSEIATWMSTPAGSVPDEATLTGTFSSPTVDMAANGSVSGLLSGSFSSPTVDATEASSALGQIAGSFSAPVYDSSATASAGGTLSGSFSAPTFTAHGGIPLPDRDILFTVTPGTRQAFTLDVGAARTSISVGDPRTEIGVGSMDKQWRKGSEQFVDFTVGLLDPEGLLTLSEVEAFPFQVAVTTSVTTPDRTDAAWHDPSIPKTVAAADSGFLVSIMDMYEALETGLHAVWVKFGPTPESPIYQVTTFVVL